LAAADLAAADMAAADMAVSDRCIAASRNRECGRGTIGESIAQIV
jgi:hypothetical protein